METRVVVADAYKEHVWELCTMLLEHNCQAAPVYSFSDLKSHLKDNECRVAILNMNTLSVDNRDIRDLTLKNPGVYFLGLTEQRFNPELKEAICYHIFACLTIPVDPNELIYWIKAIKEDSATSEIYSEA